MNKETRPVEKDGKYYAEEWTYSSITGKWSYKPFKDYNNELLIFPTLECCQDWCKARNQVSQII